MASKEEKDYIVTTLRELVNTNQKTAIVLREGGQLSHALVAQLLELNVSHWQSIITLVEAFVTVTEEGKSE